MKGFWDWDWDWDLVEKRLAFKGLINDNQVENEK